MYQRRLPRPHPDDRVAVAGGGAASEGHAAPPLGSAHGDSALRDQLAGRRTRATTARWSVPATSCTAKRTVPAPVGTSTWSIWMPNHRGVAAGKVPTSASTPTAAET